MMTMKVGEFYSDVEITCANDVFRAELIVEVTQGSSTSLTFHAKVLKSRMTGYVHNVEYKFSYGPSDYWKKSTFCEKYFRRNKTMNIWVELEKRLQDVIS